MRRFLSSGIVWLTSVSLAIAGEPTVDQSSVSSLPTFAQSKPAVDGVNGKLQVYGGAGQNNSVSISSFPGLAPQATSNNVWNGIGGATGTITVPLSHSFCAPVDLGSGAFS